MSEYRPSSINNDYEEDEGDWVDTITFIVLFIAGVAVFAFGILSLIVSKTDEVGD